MGRQADKARDFQAMHQGSRLLILPNAWDAISARIFESEGFKAIGTTSAGVAASLGYADGQHMTCRLNIEAVARICATVDLPVTADMEAGYSSELDDIKAMGRALLKAGAVGLNLEDSCSDQPEPLFPLEVMQERLQALRRVADEAGIPLFINARTDVFLLRPGTVEEKLAETAARAKAYLEAGADGIFVPDLGGVFDRVVLRKLVHSIPAPINVLLDDQKPPIQELEEIGIARVSVGPRPMRALLGLLRRISREWLDQGTCHLMNDQTYSYGDINRMLK